MQSGCDACKRKRTSSHTKKHECRSSYLLNVSCECVDSELVCASGSNLAISVLINKPCHAPSSIGRERQLLITPPAALHGIAHVPTFDRRTIGRVNLTNGLVVTATQKRFAIRRSYAVDCIRVRGEETRRIGRSCTARCRRRCNSRRQRRSGEARSKNVAHRKSYQMAQGIDLKELCR